MEKYTELLYKEDGLRENEVEDLYEKGKWNGQQSSYRKIKHRKTTIYQLNY